MDRPNFERPYKDLRARDDTTTFPLDGLEFSSVSDEQLARLLFTAPKLYHYGGNRVVRLSASLSMKGGEDVPPTESENLIFAKETLHLPVPRVYRAFSRDNMPGAGGDRLVKYSFIVMDYLPGSTVEECWDALDQDKRESVARQVAGMIETMQSKSLNERPPGPIGNGTAKFEGPWFTDYGAGPFATLQELEDWCNHKIDVCIRFQQLPLDTPRFQFHDMVLTHQDIAPRNLILGSEGKVWLVDWSWAGVYPLGFEQAVLREQARNDEFTEMVLSKLPDRQLDVTRQYAGIVYSLSTAARL